MAINPQPGGATGIVCILLLVAVPAAWADLVLNDKGYFEAPGLNVIVFSVRRQSCRLVVYPRWVISGTALIRPDLPELKIWPCFWQQTEYVIGGGATHFMFLVLAADRLYGETPH